MDRRRHHRDFLLPGAIEILHLDGPRQVRFQRIVDVLFRELLEGWARRVEVPVVIKKIDPRVLGSARRGLGVEFLIAGRMIDAGACSEEVLQSGSFLDWEEFFRVVQAPLLHGLFYIDRPIYDVFPVQHRQHALSPPRELSPPRQVDVNKADFSVRGDEHGSCTLRLEPSAQRFKFKAGVAERLRLVYSFPIRAWPEFWRRLCARRFRLEAKAGYRKKTEPEVNQPC